jgi:hypothetical protein
VKLVKWEVLLKQELLLKYSLQLAMLSKLLINKLITPQEYSKIRSKLMQKYEIIPELTSPKTQPFVV